MNRLFNRIPKNIKALTDGTDSNEHKKPNIPDNKREW